MSTVILGASQGLGEALCEIFYKKGKNVIGASRNIERLEEIQRRLPSMKIFGCDVRSEQSMKDLMEFALKSFGGISVLIYATGLNFDDVVADWTDTKGFRTVIETNLIGAANALHAALPLLSASPKAQVVAITSLAGVIGCVPGGTAYAASKAGLDAFFCSCTPELKALGIKVLIVDPGSLIMLHDSPQRQVIGSGSRYREARLKEKKGRPVMDVAEIIYSQVEKGNGGRIWSTFRIFIYGIFCLKLFLPSLLEKFALKIRFKQGGSLPNRLKKNFDSDA